MIIQLLKTQNYLILFKRLNKTPLRYCELGLLLLYRIDYQSIHMKRNIGLKDIAQKVGVSTALVSYVLNNKKEGRIKQSVAAKIREVAAELNYRTNQVAKSLKTNKTLTIGLVVADISNPFSSSLARIIEDEAEKHDYTVIFGSSDENNQRSARLIDTFLNRQVDGLLIAPGADASGQVAALQQRGVPFVLVDRYFPALRTNWVALDNYAASLSAVQHFVEQGYRRIGMISFETTLFNIRERQRGYISELKNAGLDHEPELLIEVADGDLNSTVPNAVDRLLAGARPVDALLFATNAIATAALKHINALEVRVPEELGLVSFDKTDAMDLFYSPLSYLDQPLGEIGRLATTILLDAIAGNKEIKALNLPARLVARASTRVGRFPVGGLIQNRSQRPGL
jgi:LacI family transcriptional regulator